MGLAFYYNTRQGENNTQPEFRQLSISQEPLSWSLELKKLKLFKRN